KTINAIVELMKKQMYQQMGSTSGVTETERTYNKVNVSGYTLMTYNCYPKVRTITVTLSVKQGSQNINISVKAKRYTGAKNEYTVKQFGPEHSGGGGANN
ncbi:MAG: carboxypeptidase regulatory-like domain-containing protein, partial [Mediterranea sp.]|nr:carboxypeptidase regulatory-like domain-containing protein [Mediterranea sp.]